MIEEKRYRRSSVKRESILFKIMISVLCLTLLPFVVKMPVWWWKDMPDRRIVITGLGLLSPLALSLEENWTSLMNGKSGIGPITLFDCSLFPVKIAGEIKNFIPQDFVKHHKSLKLMNRTSQLAVAAAGIAFKDSQLTMEQLNSENTGLALGTCGTQYNMEEAVSVSYGCSRASREQKNQEECSWEMNPLWPLTTLPNMNVRWFVKIRCVKPEPIPFDS